MRRYDAAGCAVGEVLLPRQGVDLQRWAVVACDQYTSQPEYWGEVEELVGEASSTLKMIFPEVYLGEPGAEARIASIRQTMREYLDQGVLVPHDGLIYLERTSSSGRRTGLMLCLDLERYDYSQGSTSLVRATEGTIVDRLPPRIAIREGAPLELPHIMVLIDDPGDTVLGPLRQRKGELTPVYDVELMKDSGHLSGWRVDDGALERSTMAALEALADPEAFAAKYGLAEAPVLLYAMGDGNHSLATAKAIWERTKEAAEDPAAVMDSPLRWALIELVNVYDESLEFEPIHRVLFEVTGGRDLVAELVAHHGGRATMTIVASAAEMTAKVDVVEPGVHRIGVVRGEGFGVVEVQQPAANLAVATLQAFLDQVMAGGGAKELDYVHDTAPVVELGAAPGNLGFYLPAMSKHDLFRSVILDGALPRKTFSMGESRDKRFYFECRALR